MTLKTGTSLARTEKYEATEEDAHHDNVNEVTSGVDGQNENWRRMTARVLLFFGLQLALFISALDMTILANSLPRIGSEFQATTLSVWVASSYLLTQISFQPLLAKLSDIFGRKHILVFGVSMFLVGSVFCGAAQSMIWLIVSRGVQGVGAAGIVSMVQIIISDIVPLEKRGNYQAVINVVFTSSSLCGPLIGGSLTDHASWRWTFFINLPIGAAAISLALVFLKLPTERQDLKTKLKRIDYAGSVLVLTSATLLLLGIDFGGQIRSWGVAAVVIPIVASVLLIGVLVFVEIRIAAEPLLPPRLFVNRSVLAILLFNVFIGMGFMATIFHCAIYFQVVRGDSATWSGIRLLPMQLMVSVLSISTGRFITVTGKYRIPMSIGPSLLAISLGLLSMLDDTTKWGQIYGTLVIGGAGMGCVFVSSSIASQATVEKRDVAVMLSLSNFIRQLGSALGLAIASAVLNWRLARDLPLVVPERYVVMILNSPESFRHDLPVQYLEATIQVYAHSLRAVWHVLVVFPSTAFLSSLFVRQYSLRRSEPNQKKDDQESAIVLVNDSATENQQSKLSIPKNSTSLKTSPINPDTSGK